jgi:hypothetical protein
MMQDSSLAWTALLALGVLLAGAANAPGKSPEAKKKTTPPVSQATAGAKPDIELETLPSPPRRSPR